MNFVYLLIALFLGSIGSIMLAGLLLFLNNKPLQTISTYLMYLSGGTLLGSVFLGMIPKAVNMTNPVLILSFILAGILFFFLLEKMILWRSCQNKECERHMHAAAPIILIGDAFHNAIDGIVIAASFLTSTEVGIFVTISVILHEIPQELGDFGILLRSGFSRRKAIWFNVLSGVTAIFFGIAAFFTLDALKPIIPYALAFSASSFLYIALADLIPEMHRKTSIKDSLTQFILISLGILIIYLIIILK
ncbi:MAG: ZIP family metal transporter [Alphaproteobacteria bacterium]|nr:ZIP family metal transporter [Alphaproteobacteria bacterium]